MLLPRREPLEEFLSGGREDYRENLGAGVSRIRDPNEMGALADVSLSSSEMDWEMHGLLEYRCGRELCTHALSKLTLSTTTLCPSANAWRTTSSHSCRLRLGASS